jgi:hypothetical protein
MRESAKHAASFTFQSQKLERLQASVESGNTALIERVKAFATETMASRTEPVQQQKLDTDMGISRSSRGQGRRGRVHKCRLALPRWLVGCVWEFGVHERDSVWTFQLSPVNLRPAHTYVFDFVRAGDVEAVRELLKSRKLSVRDREQRDDFVFGELTLLEVRE